MRADTPDDAAEISEQLAARLVADSELPWLVAHDPELDDPTPDEERLALEPADVDVEDNGQNAKLPDAFRAPATPKGARTLVAAAIPLDLRNYRQTPQQRGWGAPCTGARVTVVLAGGARVSVRAELAELVGLVMRANEAQGYLYRREDTGAYNCRKIGTGSSWSWHAWAIAIDGNWKTNPYTSPLRTDKPQWLRDRWNRFGFAGGWDYSGAKDAMHAEFMGTPAQAAQLTEIARRELGPIINGPAPAAPVPAGDGITWEPRVDAPLGTRVLQLGRVGDDVGFVQRWHGLGVDDYYGPKTDAAVRATQQRNGLGVDGVVGPQTWAVMGVGVPAPAAPRKPGMWPWGLRAGHYLGHRNGPAESIGALRNQRTGRFDAPVPEVESAQRKLVYLGLVPGVPSTSWDTTRWADGLWDDATTPVVREWFRRFRPGQPHTDRLYRDDYEFLARQ